MRWLKSRQNPDGSFINLMSTIYVTPALIGALPYDLQDIRCPKNTTGRHCLQSVSPRENWDETRVLLFSSPTPLFHLPSSTFCSCCRVWTPLKIPIDHALATPHRDLPGTASSRIGKIADYCHRFLLSVANAENLNHLQIKLEIARILFLLWVWAHCNPFHRRLPSLIRVIWHVTDHLKSNWLQNVLLSSNYFHCQYLLLLFQYGFQHSLLLFLLLAGVDEENAVRLYQTPIRLCFHNERSQI